MTTTRARVVDLDALIVGGGIAGLWLLNALHVRGYSVVLADKAPLGSGQTLASQGMIHGGIKYALGGALTGASEAIAGMPERWRECLAGRGSVDLSGLAPLSEHYHMFAAASTLGRLATFFASRALRGRIEKLPRREYPKELEPLDGVVYRLNDFVLDTATLLERLRAPLAHLVRRLEVRADDLRRCEGAWRLDHDGVSIRCARLILTAGAGNGALLRALGFSTPRMQLRPLHQVLVRHPALGPLFAHCLTGIVRPEPRLTITAHPDRASGAGRWLWYLGGQLATDGVARDRAAQIAHARGELEACVPWIDWTAAQFDTLRIDRAEPEQSTGRRPDEAFVQEIEGCLVCWPTKLSLAPDLGERVLALLPPPRPPAPDAEMPLPLAAVGAPPWER